MVWAVRTHITTTTRPRHPPATSATSQPHVVLTCQQRLSDPCEICFHWCQRWALHPDTLQSPAAGHLGRPMCCPSLSLQVQQALGKGLGPQPAPALRPPTGGGGPGQRAYSSLAVLGGIIVAAEDPQQMQLPVNDFRMGPWK